MSQPSASPAERHYLDLVAEHQSAILNYVYRLVGDADMAEDLTQETYVKAYRALGRLDLDREAGPRRRAWLYRIAHNTALDHLRRKTRLRWVSLDRARPQASADPGRDLVEASPVHQTLDALGEDHRRVLLLFNIEGFAAADVAEILGISPAAARKRRQRAGEAFREAWERFQAAPSGPVGPDAPDPGGDTDRQDAAEPRDRGDGDDDGSRLDEAGGKDDAGTSGGSGGAGASGTSARSRSGAPPSTGDAAMSRCSRTADLLAERALAGLSEPQRSELLAHAEACETCGPRIAAETRIATSLQSGRRLSPSRGLQQSLLAVPRGQRRMRALITLMLPLALCTCSLGSLLIWQGLDVSPRNAELDYKATALAAASEHGGTVFPPGAATGSPNQEPAASGAGTPTNATRPALAAPGQPSRLAPLASGTRLAIAPGATPAGPIQAGDPKRQAGAGPSAIRPGPTQPKPSGTPPASASPTLPPAAGIIGPAPLESATATATDDPVRGGDRPTAEASATASLASSRTPAPATATSAATSAPAPTMARPSAVPPTSAPGRPSPTAGPPAPPPSPTEPGRMPAPTQSSTPAPSSPPPSQPPASPTAGLPLPTRAPGTAAPTLTATATITPTVTLTPTAGFGAAVLGERDAQSGRQGLGETGVGRSPAARKPVRERIGYLVEARSGPGLRARPETSYPGWASPPLHFVRILGLASNLR